MEYIFLGLVNDMQFTGRPFNSVFMEQPLSVLPHQGLLLFADCHNIQTALLFQYFNICQNVFVADGKKLHQHGVAVQ